MTWRLLKTDGITSTNLLYSNDNQQDYKTERRYITWRATSESVRDIFASFGGATYGKITGRQCQSFSTAFSTFNIVRKWMPSCDHIISWRRSQVSIWLPQIQGSFGTSGNCCSAADVTFGLQVWHPWSMHTGHWLTNRIFYLLHSEIDSFFSN